MSRVRVAVLTVAAGLALASCTSSGGDSSDPSTPSAPTTVPTTSSQPTPTQTESAAPDTTASSPATSSPPPSSSATPAPTPSAAAPGFSTTCARLTVMVIPGGAIRGAEIAALQYVNEGTTSCTITGVPSAVLLRGGKVIGTPARSNGKAARAFTLQPGDVGESLLRDFSTCNAPLSDSIRVTTPVRGGGSTTAVRPAKLRACTVELAPVGAPA